MANRYIQISDVEDDLELGTTNSETSPTSDKIQQWIEGAEAEVDALTKNQWDTHTVTDEILDINNSTNILYTKHCPIVSITSISQNTGSEFSPTWSVISSSKYKILNANTGKILFDGYYWNPRTLKITYIAGHTTIPTLVKELALLLVNKRYIDNKLKQAASDTSVISVASIRIMDNSAQTLKYRIQGLDREIKDKIALLSKALKAKNFRIGDLDLSYPTTKRYRW